MVEITPGGKKKGHVKGKGAGILVSDQVRLDELLGRVVLIVSKKDRLFLEECFETVPLGANYLIEAFPVLYRQANLEVSHILGTSIEPVLENLARFIVERKNPMPLTGDLLLKMASKASVRKKLQALPFSYRVVLEFRALAHVLSDSEALLRKTSQAVYPLPDPPVKGPKQTNVAYLKTVDSFYADYFPSMKNAGCRLLEMLPIWVHRAMVDVFGEDSLELRQTFAKDLLGLSYESPVAAGELLVPAFNQKQMCDRSDNWDASTALDLEKIKGLDRMTRFFLEVAATPFTSKKIPLTVSPRCRRDILEAESALWFVSYNAAANYAVDSMLPLLQTTLLEEVKGKLSADTLNLLFDNLPLVGVGSGVCAGRSILPAIEDLLDVGSYPSLLVDTAIKEVSSLPLFARSCLEILACNMTLTKRSREGWVDVLSKHGKSS